MKKSKIAEKNDPLIPYEENGVEVIVKSAGKEFSMLPVGNIDTLIIFHDLMLFLNFFIIK